MNNHLIGERSRTPWHTPETPVQDVENTLETSHMQQDAAGRTDPFVFPMRNTYYSKALKADVPYTIKPDGFFGLEYFRNRHQSTA